MRIAWRHILSSQPLYTKTIIIFASIGSLRVPSFFPVAGASAEAAAAVGDWIISFFVAIALRVAWKIASLLSFSTLAEADLAITAIDL